MSRSFRCGGEEGKRTEKTASYSATVSGERGGEVRVSVVTRPAPCEKKGRDGKSKGEDREPIISPLYQSPGKKGRERRDGPAGDSFRKSPLSPRKSLKRKKKKKRKEKLWASTVSNHLPLSFKKGGRGEGDGEIQKCLSAITLNSSIKEEGGGERNL